jgi:hypothetical protein
MNHFPEQLWIDFVRGVPPQVGKTGHTETPELRADMESHLAVGCQVCVATMGFWKQIHRIAALEARYCPPQDAVRMVKMEFVARQPQETAEMTAASLVFDTFSQPIAFGVRSAAPAPRQMVYEAEGLTVDLRFDRQPYSNNIHLIGQVLGSERVGTVLGRFPVMVCTEKGVLLAESTTSSLGEFHLEFEAQDQLKLSIWVTSKKLIRIALVNLQPRTELHRTGNRTDSSNPTTGYRGK